MAETSGFFNAEMVEGDGSITYDRIYYADQFAYYFSKFISNGVYINPATQLKVTSKGELKLNVAVGDAFINGYWYKNDENFELQLAQADGSLPRIDRVVLRWDSLTRYINLAILQGNPAATPSAKNLTRNADTWELGLADVYIERGVLSISDANVTDLRPDRTYCGYVAGVVNQIDTTNLFAQFTDAFEQYYEKQVTASDKFSSDLAKKYNDYAVLAETNFGKWMTDTKGDFDTWYETIQAMLSDEEAVKLANQISELKKQFQLLALRGLKTDLFELASNDGSVFTENAQNAYVFLKQIYGKSELVNDAFISVGESGALEFDSVDATNENVSSAKLITGMPLRGFIIDDVAVANYTDANGKYWLCDSIELSVDGYWYCIKRVGSILSYNSESVGSIYKTPTGTLDKGKQVLYKLSDYVVSKLADEEQSQLSELLSYGGGKLPATTGSNAAEAIQLHVKQNVTDENGAHNIRLRNGSLQYKEGNEWKDAEQYSKNVDFSTSTSKSLNDSIEANLVLSNATRNLLPYPYVKASGSISHGVTMTYTKEGTISLDGTISDGVVQPGFVLYENVEKLFNGAVNTLYSKYDTTIKGSLHSFFQIFKKNDGSWVTNVETLSKNDYDWANYKCNYVIQYHKTSGDIHGTVSNIRIVTNADDPFVPYSGYDIKTIGKNLIPYPYYGGSSHTSNGIMFTVDSNGVIHASGTASNTAYYTLHAYALIPCLTVGNKYTMTLTVKNGTASVYLANNKGDKNTDIAAIRTLTNDTNSTIFTFTRIDGANDQLGVYITSGITLTDCQIKVQLEEGEIATNITKYNTSITKITNDTEFPITGLKSFDGITNIVSPGNVKVTYAESENGAAILDTLENKLDKDNIVNNQTTTAEGFSLDARQANPNIEGSLGAMIKAVSNKKVPSIAIENIFTGNPFIVISGTSDLAKFSNTHWDPDNGGYQINDIQYTAGATVNATVSTSLPAHSIVIIDVNTLNQDNIKVQGSCIMHNLTDNASNSSFSISFTGRSGSIVRSTIRYMPLVIHLA
jgi:hypothetical protein|nr:MAG TPA: Receptor Binding Protein [Caudoviricetes sp.]